MTVDDKQTEYERYEQYAKMLLEKSGVGIGTDTQIGSLAYKPIFRSPYEYYEKLIRENISKGWNILEIASGTGIHTKELLATGAELIATDISSNSLEVLKRRMGANDLNAVVADMEILPFKPESFDLVASAGSLSYGDPEKVDEEIRRVLRPGGAFLCVDSLNHNPIYRLNRFLHYLKGERTRNTLLRMPTIDRIESLSRGFKKSEIRFFGSISYLLPAIALVMGQNYAARFSIFVDSLVKVRRSAFKFVFIAQGRL